MPIHIMLKLHLCLSMAIFRHCSLSFVLCSIGYGTMVGEILTNAARSVEHNLCQIQVLIVGNERGKENLGKNILMLVGC